MGLYTLLVTFLCTVVLPVLLLLAAVKLWQALVIRGLDPSCTSPLPPGTMGLPFIGETLQLILQVTRSSTETVRFFRIRVVICSFLYLMINMCPLTPQRRKFLRMKRQKYGFIYKTHLFGNPTVRVMGAENVRHILLGEHKLVAVQWPASVRTILGSDTLSNVHGSLHRNKKKVSAQGAS